MEIFSPGHLLVLAVVVLVLFFGWKQLPDMARSLGRSLRIFKTEIKGMTEDDKARDAARGSAPATPAVESTPISAAPLQQPVAEPPVPAEFVQQTPAPVTTPATNGKPTDAAR